MASHITYLDLTLTAAMLTALAAMIATLMNFLQSLHTKRTYQAVIFLNMSERYVAPEMSKAFTVLSRWYHQNGDDFVEKFVKGYHLESQAALELNQARRFVSRFFLDAVRLYNTGVIDKAMLKAITARYGQKIFLNVCIPLTCALGGRYEELTSAEKLLSRLNPGLSGLPEHTHY